MQWEMLAQKAGGFRFSLRTRETRETHDRRQRIQNSGGWSAMGGLRRRQMTWAGEWTVGCCQEPATPLLRSVKTCRRHLVEEQLSLYDQPQIQSISNQITSHN